VAALAGPVLASIAQVAEAQNLFDVLRGILRGQRPPVERLLPPRLLEGFPGGELEPLDDADGPHVAYCVRLCDGRHFPMPRNAGAPAASPEQMCRAMCPATQTKVFFGGNISRATAADGQSYSSIENALLYRTKLVENCSCTGKGPIGVAKLDVESDPTLRPGDIVVTREGRKVFAGGDLRPPHKESDFRPLDERRPAAQAYEPPRARRDRSLGFAPDVPPDFEAFRWRRR
jgi:hypothetical protein